MKVTVFGAGYVGLVYASVLADVGHSVVCVDIDQDKIDKLNRNIIPIFEPGLENLIFNSHKAERLTFTTDLKQAVKHGEIQCIAVGTPSDVNGRVDLKFVMAVANAIATYMEHSVIILNKSTVPVGTAALMQKEISTILEKRGQFHEFVVVANPEFLKEGAAISDCQRPDRIIIGTDDKAAEAIVRELYSPFNRNHDKFIVMDARSAELSKYASNCMLAAKISLMNEMANLAELLGADIQSVRQGMGSDPRIGYHFIYPGIGYGGSCFPKDIRALINISDDLSFDAKILKAIDARNNSQKLVLYNKIYNHFKGNLQNKTFALWGLSFKPNTTDMREAPSRILMEKLWEAGAIVKAFDPVAAQEARRIYGYQNKLIICETKEEVLQDAEALIIVTEWAIFRTPDFSLMRRLLKNPIIFDGRNLYEPLDLVKKGFVYKSVGRP